MGNLKLVMQSTNPTKWWTDLRERNLAIRKGQGNPFNLTHPHNPKAKKINWKVERGVDEIDQDYEFWLTDDYTVTLHRRPDSKGAIIFFFPTNKSPWFIYSNPSLHKYTIDLICQSLNSCFLKTLFAKIYIKNTRFRWGK